MTTTVNCPRCGKLVAPSPSGDCPVCGASLLQFVASPDGDPADREMMDRFRTALFTQTPWVFVTPTIVAINVLVFVAMVASGVDPINPGLADMLAWGANNAPKTTGGEWWRLATSMFLHFGLIHLAFNMWVLWGAGKLLERLVGNVGFLLLYLVSGVMAGLVSLFWHPNAVGAGASGAIFGVIGGLGGFLLLRRDTVPLPILRGLRSSLGMFLILNLALGFAIPVLDLAAHLGGFIAGGVCGLVLSRPITIEHTGGRALRNLGLAALAAAVVFGVITLLPTAGPDMGPAFDELETLFAELGEREDQLLNRFVAIVEQLDRGELTDLAAADQLEQEVLVPWTALRRRMQAAEQSPLINRDQFAKLMEQLRLREESFELLVASLREGDEDKHRQHLEKWEAANDLGRELGAEPGS